MIGHDLPWKAFARTVEAGRVHHGWLLAGPRGLGKAHFAYRAAAHFLAANSDLPAEKVETLVRAGTHPDFLHVARQPREDNAAAREGTVPEADLRRNITVAQVRQVQSALTVRPSLGEARVVVIDAADDLERSAANALLKSLEEPPRGTIFLLVAHSPARLLPTIRSRCRTLRFSPLSDDQMGDALRQALPDLAEQEIAALVRAGRGSPGQAIGFAGHEMHEIDRRLREIFENGDPDLRVRADLARMLSLKAEQERYAAFLRYMPTFIASLDGRTEPGRGSVFADCWAEATSLADRAPILNHNKQAVVMEMSRLLAKLHAHKAGPLSAS